MTEGAEEDLDYVFENGENEQLSSPILDDEGNMIDSRPISVGQSSVGDSAAPIDTLGFDIYVNALADFLVSPNTHAPLTCSIEGSWGSGKSSFMLQLRNRLSSISPECRAIEFNAWKYDKQEELWAAFALKVTRSLREGMAWWRRPFADSRLYISRIKGLTQRVLLLITVFSWLLLFAGAIGVISWTVRATHDQRLNLTKSIIHDSTSGGKPEEMKQPDNASPWLELLSFSPLATSTLLIFLLIGKVPDNLRKRLFETQLEIYIDRPDYKGKAAFVDAFSEDFSKMIEAYSPQKDAKIFVFIDDLDRCEAPKVADLMQAINLMIGDGNRLIFILGLDRVKVASAIAYKFSGIIPYLESSNESTEMPQNARKFGDAFLEKFIQLAFRLPISSSEFQARKFIDSLIADSANHKFTEIAAFSERSSSDITQAAAESKRRALRIESGTESQRIRDVVMMVREVLDYSPRRIKTFLNEFRLALYLASSQGLLDIDEETGESEVTPERLGKFLVLTTRYPELRSELTNDPTFIYTMERGALGLPIVSASLAAPALEWLKRPGVRSLLSYGIDDKTLTKAWVKLYSMRTFPAGKFETILPTAQPAFSKSNQVDTSLFGYGGGFGLGGFGTSFGSGSTEGKSTKADYDDGDQPNI